MGEVDVRYLADIVWRGWKVVAVFTAVSAAISVSYALSATEWYRAEALLAPAEERSAPNLPGQLGGLAALAGVSIGGGDSAQGIAVLRSRDLAARFIEKHDLLHELFSEKWDSENQTWLIDDPRKWPDVEDAIKSFHEEVLVVTEDRRTGLVSLQVRWKDANRAADWALALVELANYRLRERALKQAEANVEFLRRELTSTNVVTLQQSIGRLLETELQKLMLARGNEEFAFVIVDPPRVPNNRISPRRSVISVVGTTLGMFLGLMFLLIRHSVAISSDESPA